MGGLENILLGLGGKALAQIVSKRFGPEMGELTTAALEALGAAFGVEPEPKAIETRIREVEAKEPGRAGAAVAWAESQIAPQLLAEAEVLRAANDQQRMTNELLTAQLKQPGWRSDWLYAWQWFLMFAWGYALVLCHALNAGLRLAGGDGAMLLPVPDLAILVTLTGLYLGLHMGGHTVLELMRGGALSRKGGAE